MSNAQDLGGATTGGIFVYGGVANSNNTTMNATGTYAPFQPYGGTANNQDVQIAQGVSGSLFLSYAGYGAAYTGTVSNVGVGSSFLVDNQPLVGWPKNQQIYYKLVGFNTNTQTFETWIIAEEIVPRTETFDPTGNFPNIDYNVFFTPPSGNKLVNIKIVGRWIQ